MQCALYLEFIFSKQCIFSKIYLCAFQIIIGLHFNFATRWANTSYDIYSEIALLIVLNYVNRSTRKMVFIYWKNAFGVCRVYCALYKCTLYYLTRAPILWHKNHRLLLKRSNYRAFFRSWHSIDTNVCNLKYVGSRIDWNRQRWYQGSILVFYLHTPCLTPTIEIQFASVKMCAFSQ